MSRLVHIFALLACAVTLSSCLEAPVLPGTVARVNGQAISFSDMEARRALLFAGDYDSADIYDDTAMIGQYCEVLNELIEETLVGQYMKEHKIFLEPGVLEAEEKRIQNDYPEGEFEQMMLERGVNIDRWRADLERRLLVELFWEHVLRPGISISADEVQAYYKTHEEEFKISEQWHFWLVSAANKVEAEQALARLDAGDDAETVQKKHLVVIRNVQMGIGLLPETIAKALKRLKPGQASRVMGKNKDFWAVRLITIYPESLLDTAEISKRVELALSEKKMHDIYVDWLERQLDSAKIYVAPSLLGRKKGNNGLKNDAGIQKGAGVDKNSGITQGVNPDDGNGGQENSGSAVEDKPGEGASMDESTDTTTGGGSGAGGTVVP